MTLHCRICGQVETSLVLPRERALDELVKKIATHCIKQHTQISKDVDKMVMQAMAYASGLVVMRNFVAIPEGETWIQEEMDKNLKKVVELTGYKETTAQPTNVGEHGNVVAMKEAAD